MMKFMLGLMLSALISVTVWAQDNVYFLPQQSKQAKNDIASLINNAQSSIDIAMYNFSYKKFVKLLKKAKKRGVKVNVIYEKSDISLKNLGAVQHKDKQKLHTKLAIFDNQTVVFGSTNWTKKSFNENLEFIYVTHNPQTVQKFQTFFQGVQ